MTVICICLCHIGFDDSAFAQPSCHVHDAVVLALNAMLRRDLRAFDWLRQSRQGQDAEYGYYHKLPIQTENCPSLHNLSMAHPSQINSHCHTRPKASEKWATQIVDIWLV